MDEPHNPTGQSASLTSRLLFRSKAQTLLPSPTSNHLLKHPLDNTNQEANPHHQEKQAEIHQ